MQRSQYANGQVIRGLKFYPETDLDIHFPKCQKHAFLMANCQENMSLKCIFLFNPTFIWKKNGVCRGIHVPNFLVLIQNLHCGYSLELPR